ncbi:MAG: polyprenol monophosphomannose synthase [Bdellovibrionia bacterium]
MKTLVILPSYNEAANITDLIQAILNLGVEYGVCVVDDNSPDGTADVIRKFQAQHPEIEKRFTLIVRSKKDGRGGAVRHGIQWGIENTAAENFVEMDCDFSHPPKDIPRGIEMLSKADIVMGSRYPDGQIIGWPVRRKVLSFCANLLAKTLISRRIGDYTNGFRFYTRKAAKFLCEQPQKHKGYIYLSETIARFLTHGFTIASFPIVFVNRERGVSNTTVTEVFNSLTGIVKIAYGYRFGEKN